MIQVKSRFLWVVVYGDTVVARLILASVAALWALMLILPGNTFDRPVYAMMGVIAPEEAWATAWAAYALALYWRTLSALEQKTWMALTINIVGVFLFGTATSCIVFSRVWPAPAAVASDIVLATVAIWLMMRSGLNNQPGWRND